MYLTLTPRHTSEKVAYKPELDYLLECFLPSTFPESSAFCPKISKLFETWGAAARGLLAGYLGNSRSVSLSCSSTFLRVAVLLVFRIGRSAGSNCQNQ